MPAACCRVVANISHRLAVALVSQVVDAFLTGEMNLRTPKAVESVLAWALRFTALGGVEHLMQALKVCNSPLILAVRWGA